MDTPGKGGYFMFLMNLTEEIRLLEQELKNKFSLARETEKVQHNKCKVQDIISLCVFLS